MKPLSLPRLNTVGNTKNKKENSMKHTLYKKVKRGFTLIEMLIVVGIIGILVALAVPALSTAMSDARQAKVSAYVSQINTALNRYVIDQEVKNQKNEITSLEAGWDKIKQYLVINGTTGPDYNAFKAAVCNGGTAEIEGGKVSWTTTTGEGEGATTTPTEYATVTGVTIKCKGN